MTSVYDLNGKEHKDCEQILWKVHSYPPYIIVWREIAQPCSRCKRKTEELFQVESPNSHGCFELCQSCMSDIQNFIEMGMGLNTDRCLRCGFGMYSWERSKGITYYTCIFGHKFKEMNGGDSQVHVTKK